MAPSFFFYDVCGISSHNWIITTLGALSFYSLSRANSHIDGARSYSNSHSTPDSAPNMDITALLSKARAKERAIIVPSRKPKVKKNQKRPRVDESTQ